MPRQDNSGKSSSKYLHVDSFNFADTNNQRHFGNLVTELRKTKTSNPTWEFGFVLVLYKPHGENISCFRIKWGEVNQGVCLVF